MVDKLVLTQLVLLSIDRFCEGAYILGLTPVATC